MRPGESSRTPKWVKIALVVVVVLFVATMALVVIAARWAKSQARTLEKQAQVLKAEATEFGRGKDAEACVAESLRRVRECTGFLCEARAKVFMRTCVREAAVPDEFCAGVPGPAELIAVGKWQVDECARRGLGNDRRCVGVIGEIPLYCAER